MRPWRVQRGHKRRGEAKDTPGRIQGRTERGQGEAKESQREAKESAREANEEPIRKDSHQVQLGRPVECLFD